MINFASCFTIGKALGWGTFLKCGVKHCLVLGPLFWECPHPRGFTLDYCFFKLIVMSAKWSLFLAPCGLSQSGQSLIIAIYKLTPNQGRGGAWLIVGEDQVGTSFRTESFAFTALTLCLSVSRLDAGFCTKPLNTEFVCIVRDFQTIVNANLLKQNNPMHAPTYSPFEITPYAPSWAFSCQFAHQWLTAV
jgi:hypothetical protein